jgi:hypothetical protein
MKHFSFLFFLITFSLQSCGQGKAQVPMTNTAPKQPPKAEIKKVDYACSAPCFDFSQPITEAEQRAISRKIDSLCRHKAQAKYIAARRKDCDAAQATTKPKPTARSATANREATKLNP